MRLRWTALVALSATLGGCSVLFGLASEEYVARPDASAISDAGDQQTPPIDGEDAGDAGTSADGTPTLPPFVVEVLRDRPVLYLRLDDPSLPATPTDPNVYEEISASRIGLRDGTVTPGVPGALGPDGGTGMGFANGSLDFGDRLGFTDDVPFTVELWLRTTNATFCHVITKQDRGTPKVGYAIYLVDGTVVFERYVNSESKNVSTVLPTDGVYRHVAATYDGSFLALFIDGQPAGTQADGRTATPTTAPLLLATDSVGANDAFFQGSLDEVAIYDRALGPDRILAHVQAAASSP